MTNEPQQVEIDEQADATATPVCLHCLTPVDPLEHYCHNCGDAVGQLTPYIPFVNIRYNYGIFSPLWHKTWHSKRTSLIKKAFYLFLIIWFVPIMLIGLPFVLLERLKHKHA